MTHTVRQWLAICDDPTERARAVRIWFSLSPEQKAEAIRLRRGDKAAANYEKIGKQGGPA